MCIHKNVAIKFQLISVQIILILIVSALTLENCTTLKIKRNIYEDTVRFSQFLRTRQKKA